MNLSRDVDYLLLGQIVNTTKMLFGLCWSGGYLFVNILLYFLDFEVDVDAMFVRSGLWLGQSVQQSVIGTISTICCDRSLNGLHT